LCLKRVAALTAAASLTALVMQTQPAVASPSYIFGVNGVKAGRIHAIFHHGSLQLPFVELASRLHRRVWRRGNTVYLQLDDEELRITPGDNVVRDGDEDVYHLGKVPILAGHDLFVGIDDVQRLLDVHVQIDGNTVLVSDTSARTSSFESHEVPLSPRISAYAGSLQSVPFDPGAPTYFGPLRDRDNEHPHVVVQLSIINGGAQGRNISLEGGGSTLQGSLDVNSYPQSPAWTYGSLVAGPHDRHVQLGQQNDALSGVVFDPKAAVGATYHDRTSGIDVFDISRNGTRRYLGVTFSQAQSVLRVSMMRQNGKTAAVLAGLAHTDSNAVGEFTREFWLSSRGAAFGVHAQTPGRFFIESLQTYATRNFPLDIGDAPVRENLGYRISPVLTVRGGFSSGYGVHSTAYFNTTLTTRYTNLLLTKAATESAFAFTTHDETGYLTLAAATGASSREWRCEGARVAGRGQLQFLAWSTNDALSDASIEWRSTRSSSAFVMGYEIVRQSGIVRASPLAGVSIALNPDLAVQLETHPLADGQRMRVSVAQRIDVPQRRRDMRTLVQVVGSTGVSVRLFVDDALTKTFDGGTAVPLLLASGTHELRAESLDGSHASLSTEVAAGTPSVTLEVLPVRSIKGRVVISDPQDFTSAPSVEGIEVDLSPGGAPALTDAGGYFELPTQPIAVGTTVSALEESLPIGVRVEGSGTVSADGFVTIVLRASRGIEKSIF